MKSMESIQRDRARSKAWAEKNKDRIREYRIKYKNRSNQLRKERRNGLPRTIKKKTPEEKAEAKRAAFEKWRMKNIAHVRAYAREYRKSDKQKQRHNAWQKSRRENFPELSKEKRNRIARAARATPRGKMESVLRARLQKKIKQGKAAKLAGTFELCGCTPAQLVSHIESLFKPGMNWQNHGRFGWHVDHILPCAMFDLTKKDHQEICFNFKNLQPLWWHENIKKSCTIVQFNKQEAA